MIKKLCLIGFVLLLSACGAEDNAEPPADLVEFKSSLPVEELWSVSIGDGVQQQFLKLYPLMLKDSLVVADRSGRVSRVDMSTGKILWQTDLDTILSAGVGGNEGRLFVASRDGQLMALDGQGKLLWKQDISSEVLAPPALSGNTVLVRSVDGMITALDARTGKISWLYERNVPALSLRGNSPMIVSQNAVYIGLDNGRLLVLDVENGRSLLDVAIATPEGRSELERMVDLDGQAKLVDGVLYIASYQGRLVAIDIRRGQLLWSRKLSTYTGVELNASSVFSSDERDHIWAFDRSNGATLWKQEKLHARRITRPVVVGNTLVVGDYQGYLHFMSIFDGHFVARVQADESGFIVEPLVWQNRLYVLTRGGTLFAYQISAAE